MNYLIVGGSIAGLACAQRLRQLDVASEIVILSEEERPYSKMSLPYLLAGKLKKNSIWLSIPQSVKFVGKQKVTAVFPTDKKIVTEKGDEFKFDKLLIASGASASLPDFEVSSSNYVFTVRNIADINGIKNVLKKSRQKKVIIAGAGLVSIEVGDALQKLGYKPVFLVSSHKILSQILDEYGSEIIKQDILDSGAEIHFGESIKIIKNARQGIKVETESGKEFAGDLAIIGKGTSPNTGFLSASGITLDRGIVVNKFLETNIKDIFAAGDVCQAYDMIRKDNVINAIWPLAVEQGRHAAMNMTHYRVPYKGSIARNIVTTFGNTVFTLGLSRNEGLETFTRKNNNRYAKISLRDGKLAGAIFINIGINPGPYIYAIQREVNVSDMKDVLLSGSLSYVHFARYLGDRSLIQHGNNAAVQ